MSCSGDAVDDGEGQYASTTFPDVDAAAMQALLSGAGRVRLEELAAANPRLLREIRSCDPLRAASTFAGLLTCRELQASCIRLEALVHLSLAFGQGRRRPNRSMVANWFATLGASVCGHLEDPAEDVFISLVTTSRGDFRIFEGIWERAGFHLQRVLGVVDAMPTGAPYDDLRSSVFALLALSDAAAARAGLDRYVLGEDFPRRVLPRGLQDRSAGFRRITRFTQSDLDAVGVVPSVLNDFVLHDGEREGLRGETLGQTSLERRPLIVDGDGLCLVLPTAVSAAVRRAVIEWCVAHRQTAAFERGLAGQYEDFLQELPLLGGSSGAPMRFRRQGEFLVAGAFQRIDTGRYLNWIFFVDGIAGYECGALLGANPSPEALSDGLVKAIEGSQAAAAKQLDFRAGLTLVVGCGWGRGLRLRRLPEAPKWRLQILNASDLETLSWTPGYTPLSLWRMLDGVEALERFGVRLHWANGLLNLVAWQRSLDEHLVPHASLPDDFAEAGYASFLMIPQNNLRALRHEVARVTDVRAVRDGDGSWVAVRKLGRSYFAEDAEHPLYVSTAEIGDGRLRAVYISPTRAWWVEVKLLAEATTAMAFEYLDMLKTWLCNAVPVLEAELSALPVPPVTWEVRFAALPEQMLEKPAPLEDDAIEALLRTETDRKKGLVRVSVPGEFTAAFHRPDNFAERMLVAALLRGTCDVSRHPFDESVRKRLLARVVPNPDARHIHVMQARTFRDHTRASLPGTPLLISEQDATLSRIGMGWRAAPRGSVRSIEGRKACQDFLNATVSALETDLCDGLKAFDRRTLLEAGLNLHESAAVDRDRWRATARANLALRNDKAAVLRAIAEHHSRLNGVFVASRIMIEAGLCACTDGGAIPGEVDLSRLMALASSLFHIGGWSDAIRWGAMEPRLKISALGDVMTNSDFDKGVLTPFGHLVSNMDVGRASARYAKNYEPIAPEREVANAFEAGFVNAWRDEFGASIDEVRAFIDTIENEGIRRGRAVYWLPLHDLPVVVARDGLLHPDVAERIATELMLRQRPEWRVVPAGFAPKDRWPWRFRRRLSLVRRPLPLCDRSATGGPDLLVAPGMVRDNFAHLVSNLLSGEFPDDYASSSAMRSWIGKVKDRAGHAFNEEVAGRMRELGWETRTEVKLTEILGRALDKDYGDVDVLAWRISDNRVLVLECKDVQFRKTPGEVAEQLADFRGELDSRNRPDLLRKHLDRFAMLCSEPARVRQFVKAPGEISLEAHLVFRNPVPMTFAWKSLASRSKLRTYEALHEI